MINKVSVIISTYNQPEFLKLTLQSFADQKGINYKNCEVIIADDGSKEDTSNLIAKYKVNYPCRLLHVWHHDNGFRKAAILNKAVRASVGEYLLFVDGDCVVNADFIANHLRLAELGYFVAGNRVLLNEEFTKQVIQKRINLQNISVVMWLFFAISMKSNKFLHWMRLGANANWRKSRSTNWRYPKGCNIAIWKSDYLSINGYDESFEGWGHEDADLFIRLLHNHILIKDGRFYVPVFHLWHKLNSRENEDENLQRMIVRANDKSYIQALLGIHQHNV